ncbi:leucine-rich repeat domain-containing protein [Candidatus Thorarchaeota archaeon]|nr:MAG: leucine-rich repeat domain-containing protein [Candidatus Thorarchaeota archaeon]
MVFQTMTELVITHWGTQGRQQYTIETSEASHISLKNRSIQRIDLSGLAGCKQLERLDLGGNLIEQIDLTPLATCGCLQALDISSNRLHTLDLYPLQVISTLDSLDLSANPLESVDITPVFPKVRISLRRGTKVILSLIYRYLLKLSDLSIISLTDSLDSMHYSPKIHWATVEEQIGDYGLPKILSSIHQILEMAKASDRFPLQRGLMAAFGLEELGGYDGEPEDLLSELHAEDSLESVRDVILDTSANLLKEQIKNGHSTLFLDSEKIAESRASLLTPQLAERRKREVSEAPVFKQGNSYDLSGLVLTYYGYEMIRAVGLGLETMDTGFEQLGDCLQVAGLCINETEDPAELESFKESFSKSLQTYVYQRIELSQG